MNVTEEIFALNKRDKDKYCYYFCNVCRKLVLGHYVYQIGQVSSWEDEIRWIDQNIVHGDFHFHYNLVRTVSRYNPNLFERTLGLLCQGVYLILHLFNSNRWPLDGMDEVHGATKL